MPSVIQRSFAGGEIAPALAARSDQVKYQTGLRTCRNFIVQRHGGVTNRPGTRYICTTKDSTKASRLLKFVFNADQTYVLEFGDLYMRVIRDGAQVESGGSPVEIVTSYLEADLFDLKYVQSGDTITITHPSYATRKLQRSSHTSWTLTEVSFVPSIDRPLAAYASSGGGSGSTSYRHRVTAAKTGTYEESLPCYGQTKTITGATAANPVEITTSASHGFSTGDEVVIEDIVGMTELNDRTFTITVTAATTFTLDGEDGTGHTAYSSGGTAARTYIRVDSKNASLSSNPLTLTWSAVTDAVEYYVYREVNGVYGYIGTSATTTFIDSYEDSEADLSDTPPTERNPFDGADNYPSTATYSQQRLGMAATNNEPEKVELSQTGNYYNFSFHHPYQDNDAFSFSVVGRQVNKIENLLELGRLIIFTSGGVWTANGDASGSLVPSSPNVRYQNSNGSSGIRPLVVGNSALYVQARGSIVRDLRYQLETDGYAGNDLSIFATHLFSGYTIVDWDYAEIPDSIVWAVRSDGALLGLTYLRDQDVWGWHRHDSVDGIFESVVAVPEGEEDAVYAIVRRTINGSSVRYIERFASRQFDDQDDAYFVDCGLSYDGRNTTSTRTMTLSGGSTWAYDEDLTLTCSASYFVSGDVGNEIHITVGDETLRCSITAYTSGTVVTVRANKTVPAAFRTTAISDWGKAVDEFSGLDHLEGETANVLADASVVTPATVSSGAITLSRCAVVVHAGLPITADIETLALDNPAGQTLFDRKKIIAKVAVMVEESRGIFAGPDEDNLVEYKQGNPSSLDTAIEPYTGTISIKTKTKWEDNGRVFIRQTDPLPVTILAVIPSGIIGGTR